MDCIIKLDLIGLDLIRLDLIGLDWNLFGITLKHLHLELCTKVIKGANCPIPPSQCYIYAQIQCLFPSLHSIPLCKDNISNFTFKLNVTMVYRFMVICFAFKKQKLTLYI